MISEDLLKKYYPTREELVRLGNYADMDCIFEDDPESCEQDDTPQTLTDDSEPSETVKEIAEIAIKSDFEEFSSYIWDNIDLLCVLSNEDKEIIDVVELGFKYYIETKNGACACDFGALYYMGQILEQDYVKAKELYEIAVEFGNSQALINLGYIYEYGRTGEPDYKKAFEIYARAAALVANSESLFKFGDMYSRGKAVPQDMKAAVSLWKKSYEVADCSIGRGHPAFRLAKLAISPDAEEYGSFYDPFVALNLFQQAEFCFRLEIKYGATYYEKNLQQAIEGQQKARELIDDMN